MGLINEHGKNKSRKSIFEKLVKKRYHEVMELTDETSFVDLIYYFKGDNVRKRFNDFENRIKLFEKYNLVI